MRKLLIFIFVFVLGSYSVTDLNAQSKRYLQLDMSAGISLPVQDFNLPFMFAERGYAASAGFDYFFGKLGFGFNGGYFMNPSQKAFSDYISHRFLETVNFEKMDHWNAKYGTLGPIYKIGYKNLEFDIYARLGYSQIHVPDLRFNKVFFNQTYEVYKFTGSSDDFQVAWNTGARLMYKFNRWIGIQAKADYFATSYMSDIAYDYTYRAATDANKNGILEDSEYFEAQKISVLGKTDLTVLNINLGLVFQLGRTKAMKPAKMIPIALVDPVIKKPDPILEVVGPAIDEELDQLPLVTSLPEIKEDAAEPGPIVNIRESLKELEVVEAPEEELIDLTPSTYDAPESRYDEEAAEFLYKAGESYFAANDFENAVPCFNKLKADPKYPRAKYMFALSLCSMGNCTEAKKEYKEFAKVYKEIDSRTLEIIFASHIERCKNEGRLKPLKDDTQSSTTPVGKVYKIQFIAIHKSNLEFPRIANIGDISTEFYPNKSVYRYTLGGYSDIKNAIKDVYKVKKMGFRDAFIAVYENGERVNTLYHSK